MVGIKVRSGAELQNEIQNCLAEANGRTFDALKAAVDKTAKQTVEQTKQKSPARTGVYQKNWAAKADEASESRGIYGKTVYNKKKPQLTHLLQYGHEVTGYLAGKGRNKTRAFDHIQSDDVTEQMLTKNLEEELDKG